MLQIGDATVNTKLPHCYQTSNDSVLCIAIAFPRPAPDNKSPYTGFQSILKGKTKEKTEATTRQTLIAAHVPGPAITLFVCTRGFANNR